jgi:lipopolysaccharide biosynthesis glycosyltransferase
VVYLDVDTVVLDELADLWGQFDLFTPEQEAAMVPEGIPDLAPGWCVPLTSTRAGLGFAASLGLAASLGFAACGGWRMCRYPRFARHAYPPPTGINSGVVLMHLERMRAGRFTDAMVLLAKAHQGAIPWGGRQASACWGPCLALRPRTTLPFPSALVARRRPGSAEHLLPPLPSTAP